MNSSVNVAAEPSARPAGAAPHLTSWYAQGRSDAVGDRLLMFDNATSGSFELLRFRADLANIPGFEQALRNRVSRLQMFRHPRFAAILAVEHLESGEGLTLVSTHVPGRRLSEMVQAPRLVGLHPTFATWLIQQLTPALADLQREGSDISHGTLNAERILVTPDGSFVIVEHVLGAAMERVRLPQENLWTEFGIASPPSDSGFARLDARTDVIQLALIVVSILLGRQVTWDEYPERMPALLDECAATLSQRSQSMIPLRRWLDRALGLNNRPFRSAEEAQLGLKELPGYVPPAIAAQPANTTAAKPSKNSTVHLVGGRAGDAPDTSAKRDTARPSPKAMTQDGQRNNRATAPTTGTDNARVRHTPARAAAALAIGFGVLAAGEAAAIAYLWAARPVMAPATRVPVTIESQDAGDIVMVDGRQAGTTPLDVSVGAGMRSIRVVARAAPAVPAVAAVDAAEKRPDVPAVDARTTAALTAAAARQRSGGLRFSSPIELKVLEGERVLGSTGDGPIVTSAGVHELDLINTVYGYRSRQTVNVRAGQIVSMSIVPPDGRVSINASPWAQVWIDGKALGETPIANVAAAVGEHDITFRHPQLGEKRETVLVRSDALTRVSASFGR